MWYNRGMAQMKVITQQKRKNLRKLRKAINLDVSFTYRQMAKYLGVSISTVFDYMQEIRGRKTRVDYAKEYRERRNNMLKEQVARAIWQVHREYKIIPCREESYEPVAIPKLGLGLEMNSIYYGGLAEKILNLFKAEVDKLTVIDDRAETMYLTTCDYDKDFRWLKREAQLQHTKKQLLDLMGEARRKLGKDFTVEQGFKAVQTAFRIEGGKS